MGPGIVYLFFESPVFGRGCFLQSLTPAEPMVQRLVHQVHMHWLVPTIIGKLFLTGEALQVCMPETLILSWPTRLCTHNKYF